MVTELLHNLKELQNLLEQQEKSHFTQKPSTVKNIDDFRLRKVDYNKIKTKTLVGKIQNQMFTLKEMLGKNESDTKKILELLNYAQQASALKQNLTRVISIVETLKDKSENSQQTLQLPQNIPPSVRPEIAADFGELEKCFNAGCYRACTIICGRIIEVCLHRKYFEVVGVDLLEKNPGIGLGKLIAKMSEKNIYIDPGLSQQIHLINQVRIYSVHKKSESFYPSNEQAYAMILYTVDIIRKLF